MEKLPARWLTEQEQALWRAYLGAWFRLSDLLDDDMQTKSGFDHLTYEIFVHLSENESRSLRMSELARRVSANKSRLTYRIGQLESEGYVKRSTCEEDGRGQWCTLTDKGFSVLEQAAPHHVHAVLQNFIEAIGTSDADKVNDLIGLFNRIAQ